MTLSEYAYKKGYTLKQYEQLQQNIKSIAEATIQNIKTLHKTEQILKGGF